MFVFVEPKTSRLIKKGRPPHSTTFLPDSKLSLFFYCPSKRPVNIMRLISFLIISNKISGSGCKFDPFPNPRRVLILILIDSDISNTAFSPIWDTTFTSSVFYFLLFLLKQVDILLFQIIFIGHCLSNVLFCIPLFLPNAAIGMCGIALAEILSGRRRKHGFLSLEIWKSIPGMYCAMFSLF